MNYFVLAVIKWQYDLIVGVLDCEFRVLSWTDIESHLMYRKVAEENSMPKFEIRKNDGMCFAGTKNCRNACTPALLHLLY